VIQFNFINVFSLEGDKTGMCPSSLIIFDKSNPAGTMRKAEEHTFTCPEFDRTLLFDFETPSNLPHGNGGQLTMSVTKNPSGGKRSYHIKLIE